MPIVAPAAVLALPAVIVATVLLAVSLAIGVVWWMALILAVVSGGTASALFWRRSPTTALRALGAEPISSADEPRLANIVDGLCATTGLAAPRLHIVATTAPNAAVIGRSADDAHLVVTRGLLDSLDRLELEAVVARELVQLRSGVEAGTLLVTVAGLMDRVGLARPLVARLLDERPVTDADLEGVRLTRYPPALASALEKVSRSDAPTTTVATRHLWLVGVHRDDDPSAAQPPPSQRIDVLREL